MNKRSEVKRSLKLRFERHLLLFSSRPFLAWILPLGRERETDVAWSRVRLHCGMAGRKGNRRRRKEKGKGAKSREEIAKDGSPFDPLGTYSLELHCAACTQLSRSFPVQYRCSFILPLCKTRLPPVFSLPLLACALVLVSFQSFSILIFCETTDRLNKTEFCLYFNTNAILSYRRSTMRE